MPRSKSSPKAAKSLSRNKPAARKTLPRRKPNRRPAIARSLASLGADLKQLRQRGARIALVPTMGALHDGHVSLVRLARKHAERVVVSIFVNPTQFAAHEDLGSYPRTFEADLEKLATEGVELVWAPTAAVMYPDGFATRIAPEGPALAGLEDRFRQHFFGGVATVVAKLFAQCRPDVALFGQKDFQQLKVVTQMSRDLDLGVRVIGAPIMRERDGLAMSSRNVYLSASERQTAPVLYRTLKDTAGRLRRGEPMKEALARAAAQISAAGFNLDYFDLRDAETLAPLDVLTAKPARLLVAAKLGKTRLIDNFKV